MAVDSNVIIYERMREEFAIGKSLKSGIDAGFDKAMWTIIDAHVTNLITALALFLFGTGPIKGFAVTLSLGIIFNLFTTLYGTRIIYDALHGKKWLKNLTFREFLKRPNIDFMGLKKFAFAFSAIISILGLLAFVQIVRGKANMGVDFTGGTLLEYRATKPFDLVEVRKSFADQGLEHLELQQVVNENRLIVKLKRSEEVVGKLTEKVTKTLNATFSDKQFTLDNQAEIGASVSESLRTKALMSIIISMLGVILYLAFRFDTRFGLAAAAATFHDVLAVLGLCWVMNIEITLLIITALLTLAGYSLNDTVVIFDRIRENTKKAGGDENLPVIINTSVNDVVSRTIVLSLTVVITVLALYLLGGSVIHDFSFAMLAGVIIGTYSSIFVASPLLMVWKKAKAAA
jgi:SecD/SecF fusion protein